MNGILNGSHDVGEGEESDMFKNHKIIPNISHFQMRGLI